MSPQTLALCQTAADAVGEAALSLVLAELTDFPQGADQILIGVHRYAGRGNYAVERWDRAHRAKAPGP